jgi:signal transduction histidine kinase/ligand-binding sensor domain-containing protein/CheY-like chemotaxis protein/AraC-like DNA-binding protein
VKYKILQLAFILLCALTGQCQDLKFYTPPGNVSQNSIADIHQDKNGFLWFATRHGANRYNGLEFKNFLSEQDNQNGLRNNTTNCFLSDPEGNVWIGTLGGGIVVFDIKTHSFSPKYKEILENLNHAHINSLFMDSHENIWIGTASNGLKCLKKGSDKLRHFTSNDVTDIIEDENGNILISSRGGGLSFYNPEKDFFNFFNAKNIPFLNSDNVIRCLYKGISGIIWIGTNRGVLKLSSDSFGNPIFDKLKLNDPFLNEYLSGVVIQCILEDSQSRLWIGTENKGMILYDLKQQKATKYQYDLQGRYNIKSNSIWSIFEDRDGTVWIGTYKNGIKKVNPREQKFQQILASSDTKFYVSYGLISSFAAGDDENLWVGTDGGGLNYIKRDEKFNIKEIQHPPFPGLESNAIVSLLNDKNGRLWVGTWGKGIYIKEKGEQIFKQFVANTQNSKTLGKDIMSLYEAPSGNIWICRYRDGLDLYVPDKGKYYQFKASANANSISSQNIISVVEDGKGGIWVGSADRGIDRFRLNENYEIVDLKNFSFSDIGQTQSSQNEITNLYIDARNTLWAGTEGNGLKKYNSKDEKFTYITKKDGLPSNIIYGLLDDGEKLWVSTGLGLASISFDKSEIHTYDISDGLQSNEFTKSSCYKTKEGILFFGGTNGFNYFNPKNIKYNPLIPDVFITDISIQHDNEKAKNNVSLKYQLSLGEVILKAEQNNLDFEFAALNYTHSSKNTYSYILENYNNEWISVQNMTTASYSNIPPGRYVFKIKASNNDDVWNPNPAILKLNILYPWYQTNLAYFTYFLLFIFFLTVIYYSIINRERLKSELKFESMERTRMEELSKVKSRFFANISHEFKTPLTLIISPLKAIQKRLEKDENKNQVNIMLRNSERLLVLINQILALSKLESGTEKLKASKVNIVEFAEEITDNFHNYAEEQFITFEVEIPTEPINVYVEKDKMEKVLINLISNAFKFTPEFGRIKFKLKKEENQVRVAILDTGIGISGEELEHIFKRFYRVRSNRKSSGTGIGLSLSRQLVELHKGKIEVQSVEGRGTTFEVFLPLGKQHLEDDQIVEIAPDHTLSEDSKIELKDFNVKTNSEEPISDSAESNLPLVLIAEDNPDLRSFTRTYLQTNYQIIEAKNGLQAFQLAKKHIPDIIITDWMMPEMTGFELTQKIRQDEKTSHIFIIMLTVKSSDESKEEGFNAGVDYYITKPFNPKLLDLRIQNILKTRQHYKSQVLKSNITLNAKPKSRISISSKDEKFLNKMVTIIDENISNSKLNIDFICKNIGFSKSQLYRKMKGLVGQSANEFIRSIRLKRAAELLLTDNFTISEVTYKVGFNDLQYFRDCFKTQYEMTPSEYIQNSKKAV